ncbi:hypothetical protein MSAN_00595900 [Mycena sanguinolenta]|uniref:Uncharacterized protein n=1 Tax=Mycena sanguinolenta TaxID=230812 RepID=A0A8H7DGU8_9AGAR|nr:hypothetical protein MSAN_00595900 [Mycena sanguinolenta]
MQRLTHASGMPQNPLVCSLADQSIKIRIRRNIRMRREGVALGVLLRLEFVILRCFLAGSLPFFVAWLLASIFLGMVCKEIVQFAWSSHVTIVIVVAIFLDLHVARFGSTSKL